MDGIIKKFEKQNLKKIKEKESLKNNSEAP